MINCEYYSQGSNSGVYSDFEKYTVPRHLISSMDKQVCQCGKGDAQFKISFDRILREKFNAHTLFKEHIDFVTKMVNLFDLLVEYRNLEAESSDEFKTFYLNEILLFYNHLERYDLYVNYVEKLVQIHKESAYKDSKYLVCSAHTLKLHAQLLNWTSDPIEYYLRHSNYPHLNSHRELKEQLFIDIINDFTEGEAWEKALDFSKILRERYDTQFEMEKLCTFLRKQADLCEKIVKQTRYDCNYFLVGFFGKGFPKLLQNKKFVFKSGQLEQIISFRPRVESWFPNAKRISHSNPVADTEINSDRQCNEQFVWVIWFINVDN